MCIICISKKGIEQPTKKQIETMFSRNKDGAGYMYSRNGEVFIHKGFMELDEFLKAIERERFTKDDVVVYHFRISTQAGVNREMCHPFGLSTELSDMKALDLIARVGIAHNGIIALTTDKRDREYSDTAHFIAEWLPAIIRNVSDIKNQRVLDIIYELAQSKFAFLDGNGYVATVGDFITEDNGLMFSNSTYRNSYYTYDRKTRSYHFSNGQVIRL